MVRSIQRPQGDGGDGGDAGEVGGGQHDRFATQLESVGLWIPTYRKAFYVMPYLNRKIFKEPKLEAFSLQDKANCLNYDTSFLIYDH